MGALGVVCLRAHRTQLRHCSVAEYQLRCNSVKTRADKNLVFNEFFLGFEFLGFLMFFNLQMPDTKLRPTSKDSAI